MTATIKRLYHKLVALPIGIFLSLGNSTSIAENTSSYLQRPEVQSYIEELVTRDHFNRNALETVFSQAQFRPSIIRAMDKPYKQAPAWYKYAPPLISEDRLSQGIGFWHSHRNSLEQAEALFGVPAPVIVAIIGIETFYGQNTGNYRLIDSLTTLAFDYPRRSAFFKDELRQFLLMAQEAHVDPLEIKGSFAGAIGFPQFMPSSYRKYGVDFDQDGQINLWNSPDDAIGSVAHFLKEHGWQKSSWSVRAVRELPFAFLEEQTQEKGLSTWKEGSTWEMLIKNNSLLPKDALSSDLFALMKLETVSDTPFYVWVGPNFKVITQYNHSRLYASAVWTLACRLAEAKGTTPCDVRFPF